jgi:hypothetical protein
MPSEKQINANRINGAKSRGAITPEGRLASSRHSLVHGLLSEAIILDGESAERFNALHDSLIEEYQPETSTECGLVEIMVVCRWRLMRVWILENSAVAHQMRKEAVANALENQPTQAALALRSPLRSSALPRHPALRRSAESPDKKKVILPNEPNLNGKLNRHGASAILSPVLPPPRHSSTPVRPAHPMIGTCGFSRVSSGAR